MDAPHFFCTFTSLNSIYEPNDQVCVLGAISEHYEALCDVHVYVCMCLRVSVNYGQPIRVIVVFHKIEWVHMVLRILNLEGQQNFMIGSKVTTILSTFFSKKSITSNIGMWGVYQEAIYWNIALRTQILIWASISESLFLMESHFRYIHNRILLCQNLSSSRYYQQIFIKKFLMLN